MQTIEKEWQGMARHGRKEIKIVLDQVFVGWGLFGRIEKLID
jgi:hypothetical protein